MFLLGLLSRGLQEILWRIGSAQMWESTKRSILRTSILWEIDWVCKLHIYYSGKKATCTQTSIIAAIMA